MDETKCKSSSVTHKAQLMNNTELYATSFIPTADDAALAAAEADDAAAEAAAAAEAVALQIISKPITTVTCA